MEVSESSLGVSSLTAATTDVASNGQAESSNQRDFAWLLHCVFILGVSVGFVLRKVQLKVQSNLGFEDMGLDSGRTVSWTKGVPPTVKKRGSIGVSSMDLS
jgi:hypothetical protein